MPTHWSSSASKGSLTELSTMAPIALGLQFTKFHQNRNREQLLFRFYSLPHGNVFDTWSSFPGDLCLLWDPISEIPTVENQIIEVNPPTPYTASRDICRPAFHVSLLLPVRSQILASFFPASSLRTINLTHLLLFSS